MLGVYLHVFDCFQQNLPGFFSASSQQMKKMRKQSRLGQTVNAMGSRDSGMRRKNTAGLILSFERRLITADLSLRHPRKKSQEWKMMRLS